MSTSRSLSSPERNLMSAVLQQAIEDLTEPWKPPRMKKQWKGESDASFVHRKKVTTNRAHYHWKLARQSARTYLFGPAKDSSFVAVCHMLDLDPVAVREGLRKRLLAGGE